jgi:hypothetical protein
MQICLLDTVIIGTMNTFQSLKSTAARSFALDALEVIDDVHHRVLWCKTNEAAAVVTRHLGRSDGMVGGEEEGKTGGGWVVVVEKCGAPTSDSLLRY